MKPPGPAPLARRENADEPPASDRQAEQTAIAAAAGRLLAGTPLRPSGKLTVSALITESGLRRDIVYEHAALVESFRARAKVQQSTPLAMQQLTDEHAEATRQVATLKAELAAERAAGAQLRRLVAELSLELQQTREGHATAQNVTRLRPPSGTRPVELRERGCS
jgi:chromosome segregation ATPase